MTASGHFPSVLACLFSSLVLVIVYLYVNSRQKEPFLAWWTLSWVLYAARFVLFTAGFLAGRHPVLSLAEHLCILGSAMALYHGTRLIKGVPTSLPCLAGGGLAVLWLVFAIVTGLSPVATALPVYIYTGAVQIKTGLVFLRLPAPRRLGENMAGYSLVVWGLHKLDYPFLVNVGWFAPWGFLLGASLALLVALGQLLWFFENTRTRLSLSERRYRGLYNAAPVGIFLYHPSRGVVDANERAASLLGYSVDELLGLTAKDFIDERDLAAIPVDDVASSLTPGQPLRLNRVYKRKTGERMTVEVDVLHPPGDEELLVIFQDVTERQRTSRALEESERRYRLLFEKMQNGFALHEVIPDEAGRPADYRFEEINPAFERMMGMKSTEVAGRTVRELIPDIDPLWIERYGRVALTGEPDQFERYNKHIEKYFSVLAYSPSRGHLAVIFTDVTSVTLARRTLEENEQRFRTLMENIPGAFYRSASAREWTMTYLSDGVEDVTGYPASDFIGNSKRSFADIIHPDDRDAALEALRNSQEAGGVHSQEFRILHKDGSTRWIHEKGRCVYGPEGKLLFLDGLFLDVTERKTAENALHKALAFNQMILRHTPVAVSVFDGDSGQCLMANDVLAGVFDDRMEQLVSKSFRDLASWREAGLVELAEQALEGLGMRRKDVRVKAPGGRVQVLDCMFVRFDVDAKPYLLRVATDITDRVRMEEVMIQTEKMMSVGGLAAGMAHEINNPLGGILQGVQVATMRLTGDTRPNRAAAQENGCSMESIRAYATQREVLLILDQVRTSAVRAARIVSGMLEFARQTDYGKTSEDLRVMLDKAVELCSSDYDLKKKYDFRHINIERHYQDTLPPVECGRTQIEQVFMNILRNSAQAMHGNTWDGQPPRIVLRVDSEDSYVRVAIEDNGPGIDEDTKRHIFEPFFTTKQPGEGTGLGLSVSYFIVTSNHGGTIEAAGEPGKGAAFIIRLPVEGRLPGRDPGQACA